MVNRTHAFTLGLIGLWLTTSLGVTPVPWVASTSAATEFMAVSDVRAGMVGVGRTVFEGTTIEEFRVHVLGVIRNMIGPRRDLILARLEGGPLATTGVIAGMSGSPVYIDGKLIGAVSYSLGQFSREAIAGITPIGEMIDATSVSTPRLVRGPASAFDQPVHRDEFSGRLREVFAGSAAFATREVHVQVVEGRGGALSPQIGTLLRPIGTPLTVAGAIPEVAGLLTDALRGTSLVPVLGGTLSADVDETTDAPLEPGSAVGIDLLNGDLVIGSTGTVTHIDGSRLYAFGHPLYNLGPIQFPMTRAYIHTLIPSLAASTKLASSGATIGTIRQDRATAVAGTLGPGPEMIPLTITLDTDRGLSEAFTFRMVDDRFFTPLLAYLAVYNTLGSYERENGAASFTVSGSAQVDGHEAIAFDNVFAGTGPAASAANYVAGPITTLLTNDDQPVRIEGIDLTIRSTEEPRRASLERVWVDARRVRPGDTVPVRLLVRSYRGEDVLTTLPVAIPAFARGRLTVEVSDGARRIQQQAATGPQAAKDVSQIVRAFNRSARNDRLYVRLLATDAGAIVRGEALSSVPPTVLAVLEADRAGDGFTPLTQATLGEWEVPVDFAVTGSRLITLDVEAY